MKLVRSVGPFVFLALGALASPAFADGTTEAEKGLVELYQSGKLFDKNQYRGVRAVFAEQFEAKQQAVLRKAYGDDYGKLTAWLKTRPDIKEEFYTALDERHDKLEAALALFKEIWKAFPDKVEPYASAAIAVAVTWDDERRAVYDYAPHQRRTKSTMPAGLVDGLGNFRYLVEEDKALEMRARYLPWEFLVFVVDHRTPLGERKWAQGYYQQAKGRVKSWHQDVPYDHDMLKGEKTKNASLRPHLEGCEYTLANIRARGGVCAQQADFAARVAKSVCIPAVYCWGESSYRGLHAWTLLVQLQQVSRDKIVFSLVSDGRYVGFIKDAFYTGFVTDPKSGERMLDRDMERRLWVVGNDRMGKRQADLIMRAYPGLCKQLNLDAKARVEYIDRCLKVSPYNESAWLAFAQMAKSGALDADQKRVVLAHLASLCKRFAGYPDFIWKVFDDLLTAETDAKERIKQYELVVGQFERAGRPDLACDARLKITQLLAAEEKWQTAGQGLVFTIRKFPTEGRYVPKLTAKLQEVSKNYKGGTEEAAKLYLELIPGMVQYYKDDTSEYCVKMYNQAMQFFRDNNLGKYADALKTKVDIARLLGQKN
jgi:hypothetical protein